MNKQQDRINCKSLFSQKENQLYFAGMFSDGCPQNEMPTLSKRPETIPIPSKTVNAVISSDELGKITEKFGISTETIIVSALAITLAKYVASEDVALGISLYGSGMLPIRLKPVGMATASGFLRNSEIVMKEVLAHSDCGFETIIKTVAAEEIPSRFPVFDLLVNIYGEDEKPSTLKPAIDLVLDVCIEINQAVFTLNYSDLLYYDEVCYNFMEQLITIISRFSEQSYSGLLCDIAELPERQLRQILDDFQGTENNDNQGKTIVELFREQAKKYPESKAVTASKTILTYREFDELTDRIAAFISQKSGTNPVGIMLNRTEMMPVCAMGVLKAGAPYVPLIPSYPPERIEFMLKDSGAKVVLCDSSLMEKVGFFEGEIINTLTVMTLPKPETLPKSPAVDDLFVLLYTSGTTGNPKGVKLHHQGIINYANWYSKMMDIQPGDNLGAHASFSFDAHLMDYYPTLSKGACLHVLPQEILLDLDSIQNYVEANDIKGMFITTQLGRQYAELFGNKKGSPLKYICVGGETLTPLPPPEQFVLVNIYGPTETTIAVNSLAVDKLYDRVPIGGAAENTRLYVVDKYDRLCPVGVSGELLISGVQVAYGYLNRPDLTSEKFIKNPFTDNEKYQRTYRSGDIVRFLPNGYIDIIGRQDFQVKIRGYRIELGEIETKIRQFDGIDDAIVIAIDAPGGGKRVVSYIVSKSTVDIGELNEFIAASLPSFMVPSATMQIERIPLTQNGKVDKRALPEIKIVAEDIVLPETETEQKIFGYVSQIVEHKEFGVTTNLLDIGISSLSAIKLSSLITRGLGKKVGATDILRFKTIKEIIAQAENSSGYIETKTYEKRQIYPLTQNQMGLYYECIKEPESLSYNIPALIRFDNSEGKIDAERLQQSLLAVIEAHCYLKTRLTIKDGEVCQVRNSEANVEIPIIRLSENKDNEDNEINEIQQNFIRPFNFFEGPLYRINIYKGPNNIWLLFDFHHIIFDGGSFDIFITDIAKAYAGVNLEKEEFTSFDLSLLEKERENSDSYHKAKAFFADKMKDSEGATLIPRDFENKEGNCAPIKVYAKAAKKSIADGLRKLDITPATLFLCAVSFVASRFGITKSVGMASISNGRNEAYLQNNMGMLVKTLPVLLNINEKMTVKEFAEYVQKYSFDVMENSSYPFTHFSSDFKFTPQILYSYQAGLISKQTVNGVPLNIKHLEVVKAKFPVDISIEDDADNYIVSIESDGVKFKEKTILTFAECVLNVAVKFASGFDREIGSFSIATDSHIAAIRSFSDSGEDYTFTGIHQLFEKTVSENPDSLAVIAVDGTLTYKELNEKANALAAGLLEKGLAPEDRVAFMLPRTSKVFAAIYGINKAGGAFIPIDPDYPKDRIDHVLFDSQARYIITDGKSDFENGLDINELLANNNTQNHSVKVDGENLSYLIYTSGSTGKPKGVMLTHRGIINFSLPQKRNIEAYEALKNKAKFVAVGTVSFDLFLSDVFIPLSNGLCVIMATEEQARNPVALAELIEKTGANALNTTPSVILQYTGLPKMQTLLGKFKMIIIGAEKFPPGLFFKLRSFTNALIFNSYGPTEATIDCNSKIIESVDDAQVPAGKPESGVIEFIMDTSGNPVPVGVVGELWIGGRGVARGYWGREDLTEERFVLYEGVRFYKSGDLAMWNTDGEVVILGRNDSQIKLRGLRIELGEVESAIMSYEGIERYVVMVKKIKQTEHLCAYYSAKKEIKAEHLREHIAKSLPKYMVPSAFLQIREMPVTPNGKIDTKVLPEAKLLAKNDYEEPKTELEKIYCDIYSEVLEIEKVGALDNFFDIGGTSLLVTKVIVAAMEKNIKLTFAEVFKNPTPRELAALAANASDKPTAENEQMKNYDYSPINKLLANNTTETFLNGQKRELGNIMITGATGFLGIHILYEFINNCKGVAYCIVRGGKNSAESRLKAILAYYFDNSFDELFGSKIVIIDGDVCSKETYETMKSYPVDTLINCAANVKHFSAGTDIYDINVGGVKNGIEFSRNKKCRFIQISTTSIAGTSVNGIPDEKSLLDEKTLYFGQDVSNKYVYSKIMAERIVLEAAHAGADAKIIRVGNLMARDRDGEFQINFKTNNFLGQLKAYYIIGSIPFEDLAMPAEFSPVDKTAKAILTLSEAPQECTVFHAYNNHAVYLSDVVDALRVKGVNITPVEFAQFKKQLSEAMTDQKKATFLSALIAYNNPESGGPTAELSATNTYTVNILHRLGFSWPLTSSEYLYKFIEAVGSLGYFDMDFGETF